MMTKNSLLKYIAQLICVTPLLACGGQAQNDSSNQPSEKVIVEKNIRGWITPYKAEGQALLFWENTNKLFTPAQIRLLKCESIECTSGEYFDLTDSENNRAILSNLQIDRTLYFKIFGLSATGKTLATSDTISTHLANVNINSIQSGLMNVDGTKHQIPEPDIQGNTINALQSAQELGYTIDLENNTFDDLPAIQAVINNAGSGSRIYFPNGTYNLGCPKNYGSQPATIKQIIINKNAIAIIGEDKNNTIFISDCDDIDGNTYRGISIDGANNILLEKFTISSTWNKNYPTSSSKNNPSAGGLSYPIIITSATGKAAFNIAVKNLKIEKYRRAAITVGKGSHDIAISGNHISNATDTGDGGFGYGIQINGGKHQDAITNPFITDPTMDTYFVKVTENVIEGPYIRHGILLQYWTHNNEVSHNLVRDSKLDAIDLHGEDEYLNDIAFNAIINSQEAGIGIGNNGAEHDKAGPLNLIRNNDIQGCPWGIQVHFGSNEVNIENNVIRDTSNSFGRQIRAGITVGKSDKTIIRGNLIRNNTVEAYHSLYLQDDPATGKEPMGGPTNLNVYGNSSRGSGNLNVNQYPPLSNNYIQATWE